MGLSVHRSWNFGSFSLIPAVSRYTGTVCTVQWALRAYFQTAWLRDSYMQLGGIFKPCLTLSAMKGVFLFATSIVVICKLHSNRGYEQHYNLFIQIWTHQWLNRSTEYSISATFKSKLIISDKDIAAKMALKCIVKTCIKIDDSQWFMNLLWCKI